ncbi:class I tRNA ligase family protein [Candidatus Peregrinibacteria bacterium]|nr:MAG: class I tRNA ligase family protein [Candidatus Peregrinibacteria bacterium]
MSKSTGNVIDPVEVIERYGIDAMRYYLLREISNGRDGDFSDALFMQRYQSDLANNLGNLVNRVHTLIKKNHVQLFTFQSNHEVYELKVAETWRKYQAAMDEYNVHEAVFHVWRLIDFANKMIDDEKPWALLKTDPGKAKETLCNLLEVIRHISMMIWPIIPHTAERIRSQIGLPISLEASFSTASEWGSHLLWNEVGESEILFPRIES